MTAPSPRRRASRLGPQRRMEIFEAVIHLVIERGYEATTIDAIAEQTRTSKATLYRQWQDKPTLIVTAIAELSEVRLDQADTGSLAGDLEALTVMLASRASRNIPLALALAQAARQDQRLRQVLDRFLLPQLPMLDAIGARAVVRGEIADARGLRYLPHLLIGGLFGPIMLGRDDTEVSASALMNYLHDVILPAVAPGRDVTVARRTH